MPDRPEHDDLVRARASAIVAAVWALGYVLVYVTVVRNQGNDLAWWYVGLVWLASLLASSVVFVRSARPTLLAALVVYACCMVLAALTIGALLLPSVLATALALVWAGPARTGDQQGTT
jgi:cytochrome bd-type quinol oxidase subunit 2